ncbi:MAG: hypothetical protein Q7U53_04690 [Anaerolineaceae bacterium]|nr:hypothetical protein [Anaerolineaceae bacterium]
MIRFTPFRKLSPDETTTIDLLVSQTSEKYYKTKGPITTASKLAGDFFNECLNRINVSKNNQAPIIGSLHFLVLNKDDLYFLHAGGATSFLFSKTTFEKFEDRTYGIEGIGIGKSVHFRFFHAKVTPNVRVVLSTRPPKTWTTEALLSDQRLSISHLRRALIHLSQDDFEAIIIQLRPGNGSVHQLRLDSSELSTSDESEKDQEIAVESSIDSKSDLQLETIEKPLQNTPEIRKKEEKEFLELIKNMNYSDSISDSQEIQIDNYDQGDQVGQTDLQQLDFFEQHISVSSPEGETTQVKEKSEGLFISGEKWQANTPEKKKISRRKERGNESKGFAIFLLRSRSFIYRINEKYRNFTSRIRNSFLKLFNSSSVESENDPNSLSPSSMLMIAILAGVFVSAIGITVYLQSGIGSQQKELIANANLLVSDALDESDSQNQILMYDEAMRLVIESENYGKSDSVDQLKQFIQLELDKLQGVTRIEVQSTILGGLDRRIQISRMGINPNGDLYALDSGTGRVIRMIATRPDYVVDTTFNCGPGKYDEIIVDSLIDIEPVNFPNRLNTSLIAIDTRGNLLLCIPGSEPVGIQLKRSDMNWGEIKSIAFNGFNLYVLDIGDKTRDIYRFKSNDYAFDLNPESIFASNIPENLAGSNDIAVSQDELFLIHANGQLTRCNLFGGSTQSSCENNIGYGVIMDGKTRENISVLSGTQFDQVYLTLPPDPSIYFQDVIGKSIYHFSMALNMQQQIRPNLNNKPLDLTSELTSFAVSPNGIVHFAYGNQIYFGYLP